MNKFQPSEISDVAERKDLFNVKYAPFIQRDWLVSSSATEQEILSFISRHSEIIAKPTDSGRGDGIRVIHNANTEALTALLNDIRNGSVFIIEELLHNEASLRVLNPTSLNTFRIVTVVDASGEVHILVAALRMGAGKSPIDNVCAGGIMCRVDLESGIIDSYGLTKHLERTLHHPTTGIQLIGLKIPRWDEVLAFVREVASFDKRLRYVGWDIALLPDRVELIEGNCLPDGDFLQVFDQEGQLPKLMSYL